MELEELKNKWQHLSVRTDVLENDNRRLASELAKGRIQTAQRSLVDFYVKMGWAGMLVVALAPMIYVSLEFPLWVAIVYGLFGLLMSVLNFRFSRRIARTDYFSMPVVSALSLVVDLRKKQKQLRALGLLLCLIVLGSLGWSALDVSNESIYIGFIAGLALGIPLAIIKMRRAVRLARKLQEELERDS